MESGKWKIANFSMRILVVIFILSCLISFDTETKNIILKSFFDP
jgi:hypothetical protein